mmetsp:Transcript_137043/g.238269  ORF Transcript_137043/g.238269 Transcript_137043/m.238269 type:complete len:325 (-) Transcript_137043:1257-2231(-)
MLQGMLDPQPGICLLVLCSLQISLKVLQLPQKLVVVLFEGLETQFCGFLLFQLLSHTLVCCLPLCQLPLQQLHSLLMLHLHEGHLLVGCAVGAVQHCLLFHQALNPGLQTQDVILFCCQHLLEMALAPHCFFGLVAGCGGRCLLLRNLFHAQLQAHNFGLFERQQFLQLALALYRIVRPAASCLLLVELLLQPSDFPFFRSQPFLGLTFAHLRALPHALTGFERLSLRCKVGHLHLQAPHLILFDGQRLLQLAFAPLCLLQLPLSLLLLTPIGLLCRQAAPQAAQLVLLDSQVLPQPPFFASVCRLGAGRCRPHRRQLKLRQLR